MKKVVYILAFLFVSNVTFGQSLFDELEDLEEVSSVVITKDMFDLLKQFPDAKSEDMEVFNTAKGLDELKMFSTDDLSIATKMEQMVNTAIKNSNLTQLMRVKDKGSRVKIYVKTTPNKEIVSEVLMFVKSAGDNQDGKSSTVVSLTGDINLKDLSKITNKYSDSN